MSSIDTLLPVDEVGIKVKRYEDFLDTKLRPQLAEYVKARDTLKTELSQYLQLRETLQMLRDQKLKTFQSRVDAGHEFYLQAETKDLNKIMVKVSREYFVEMN